jgi:branched-chain amino acid transport system permease protein
VIGAVLVTWLEVMLSDLTDVWQLYFGLLFVGMVMLAPNGIAGLLMMHAPLWQSRAYGSMLRLALAYLVALVPALVMLVGLVLVIEMTYHLSVKASEGTTISVFHVALDSASVMPWVTAAVLLCGGFWLFRMTWPVVGAAWQEAFAKAHGARRAK